MSNALKDKLGKRIKENYEYANQYHLVRRMPVMIRLDGRAFHTFTKDFEKPFDEFFSNAMDETMQYLCENIQGCVLGYTQSDEITLVLVDYENLDSTSWFGYNVQKLASVSASMATFAFNKSFYSQVKQFIAESRDNWNSFDENRQAKIKRANAYNKAIESGATFDSRCFNIPVEEVTNAIYWRELDAVRNSKNQYAQNVFSQEDLFNKKLDQVDEMLKNEGLSWDELPHRFQMGACCVKRNGKWTIDVDFPLFVDAGRQYIDDLIVFHDE